MKKRAIERRDEAIEFSDDDNDERRSKEVVRGKKGFGMRLSFFFIVYPTHPDMRINMSVTMLPSKLEFWA